MNVLFEWPQRETTAQRHLHRTDNEDVDKAATYEWLSSPSLKEETCFILAPQDQSIPRRVFQSRILKIGPISVAGYAQTTKTPNIRMSNDGKP